MTSPSLKASSPGFSGSKSYSAWAEGRLLLGVVAGEVEVEPPVQSPNPELCPLGWWVGVPAGEAAGEIKLPETGRLLLYELSKALLFAKCLSLDTGGALGACREGGAPQAALGAGAGELSAGKTVQGGMEVEAGGWDGLEFLAGGLDGFQEFDSGCGVMRELSSAHSQGSRLAIWACSWLEKFGWEVGRLLV